MRQFRVKCDTITKYTSLDQMDLEAQKPAFSLRLFAESFCRYVIFIACCMAVRSQLVWIPTEFRSAVPHTILIASTTSFMYELVILALVAAGAPPPTNDDKRFV